MTVIAGLSDEQRLLLAGVGGWVMVWALTGSVDRLMDGHGCASRLRDIDGHPEFVDLGYRVEGGAVRLGWLRGSSDVVVTRRQIERYAASLEPELVARLRDCREREQRLSEMAYGLNTFAVGKRTRLDQYRPRWSKQLRRLGIWAACARIREEETALLREALCIDLIVRDEPADLLELLEVVA